MVCALRVVGVGVDVVISQHVPVVAPLLPLALLRDAVDVLRRERRLVVLLLPLLHAEEVAVADLDLRLQSELDHDHDVAALQQEVHVVVAVVGDADAVLARRLHLRN